MVPQVDTIVSDFACVGSDDWLQLNTMYVNQSSVHIALAVRGSFGCTKGSTVATLGRDCYAGVK